MGLERLIELISASEPKTDTATADVYLLGADERFSGVALLLADRIREAFPALRVQVHCGGGSMKSQFKKADRSGAKVALILGGDEIESGQVTIKFLRDQSEQFSVDQDNCLEHLDSIN